MLASIYALLVNFNILIYLNMISSVAWRLRSMKPDNLVTVHIWQIIPKGPNCVSLNSEFSLIGFCPFVFQKSWHEVKNLMIRKLILCILHSFHCCTDISPALFRFNWKRVIDTFSKRPTPSWLIYNSNFTCREIMV